MDPRVLAIALELGKKEAFSSKKRQKEKKEVFLVWGWRWRFWVWIWVWAAWVARCLAQYLTDPAACGRPFSLWLWLRGLIKKLQRKASEASECTGLRYLPRRSRRPPS
jgi:hypothetical protein